jgi:hypothetical protein
MAQTKTKGGAKPKGGAKRSGGSKKSQARSRDTGRTVSRIATGAKIPLVAAGAAIAGAAGGAAWGSRHAGSRGLRGAIARRPKVKIKSGDVAKAAKEIGQFAIDVQSAREANGSTNGVKHRSPIEVVLDGLTARR